MHTITVHWKLEHGSEGVDDDPFNPLARATKKLLVDGSPQPAISLCFFDPGLDEDRGHKIRWVGAFVLSAGNQLIFFPGFASQHLRFSVCRNNQKREDYQFPVDHITLEKQFIPWHISGVGPRDHLRSFRTRSLGEGRVLWAGISVSNFDVLREVKKETLTYITVPEADSERRGKLFLDARQVQKYPCLTLHPEALSRFNPGFLHLSLIVGPSGFHETQGDHLALPSNSSFLKNPLSEQLRSMPMQSQKLSLNPRIDLEILALWLPGTLSVPIELTSPS